jgi:hypothetical protein
MSDIPEPIAETYFDKDLHDLNKEIIRLSEILDIDISNTTIIHALLNEEYPYNNPKDENYLTVLKGLILLRGHMRQEREESGLDDGIRPIDEPMYKKIKSDKTDE